MELALAHHGARVVGVAHDDRDQRQDVEDPRDGEQGVEPAGVVALLVVLAPGLGPAVREVNDEDQLDDDEHEASDHPEVHPRWSEVSMRDEESSDPTRDDECVLESPESVLNARSRVSAAPDTDHDEGHEQEEDGDDETDSVDGKVADSVLALDLDVRDAGAAHAVQDLGHECGRLLAEGDLGEEVLDPGGEHHAGDDEGDEQQQPVHDARPRGVLAAGAERAARRARRGGEAAGQGGEAEYAPHVEVTVVTLWYYCLW